jgi:hypothetical protein
MTNSCDYTFKKIQEKKGKESRRGLGSNNSFIVLAFKLLHYYGVSSFYLEAQNFETIGRSWVMENVDVFLGLHDFLERMRQPSAADLVKSIKRYCIYHMIDTVSKLNHSSILLIPLYLDC